MSRIEGRGGWPPRWLMDGQVLFWVGRGNRSAQSAVQGTFSRRAPSPEHQESIPMANTYRFLLSLVLTLSVFTATVPAQQPDGQTQPPPRRQRATVPRRTGGKQPGTPP